MGDIKDQVEICVFYGKSGSLTSPKECLVAQHHIHTIGCLPIFFFWTKNQQRLVVTCVDSEERGTRQQRCSLILTYLNDEFSLALKIRRKGKYFRYQCGDRARYYHIIFLDCENNKQVPMNLFGFAGS